MDCVLQVELFSQCREIVGVGVHLITIPRLGRTAVTSPVACDDSIALLAEEHHLSVPVVRGERPPVTEHYGLAFSPVLVVNLCAVFCCNCWHNLFSLISCNCWLENCLLRNLPCRRRVISATPKVISFR